MRKDTLYKLRYLFALVIIVACLVLVGCRRGQTTEVTYNPIYGFKFPSWDFLVWPMAALMYGLGKIFGGEYFLVIIVATIIVRTAAWPIYAKSNDMTLKMQMIAPETAKIEAKYAGRTDQDSLQRKQMETMQLYKKYGIGLGGCFMPFLQLPIFIAFYETLRRIPVTRSSYIVEHSVGLTSKLPLDFDFLDGYIFNIDLFSDMSAGGWQKTGIWILAIVVALTQLASQILMNLRQKKQREAMQSDIPAYRRPERTDQQKQSETMMKVMMYGMPVMMVLFIIRSPAALGLYWLVGNIYSALQSYLGSRNSAKRMQKIKEKMDKKR
ncbi:MAG: YidC/Oxa1 family membrane protein insertase [Bacilli bacterium]|nr:YidC/Oxa1 family membrane protein insertase [Bacilli bacterium]